MMGEADVPRPAGRAQRRGDVLLDDAVDQTIFVVRLPLA